MSLPLFQLVVTLVAIVVAGTTPISVAIYLGTRIDGLSDRLGGVEQRLTKVEGRLGQVEGRLERVEGRLVDHAATHARLAHGRPPS